MSLIMYSMFIKLTAINSIEKYQIHLFCAIIVMLIIKFINLYRRLI